MNNQLEKYNPFEADLISLENECNFLPDVSNKDGYEKSKRIGIDGRAFEIKVDEFRKQGKKELSQDATNFHEAGKAACDRISQAYKPHQEAYKAVDEEKKRVKAEKEAEITARINVFSESVTSSAGMNSVSISSVIDNLMADPMEYGSRTIEAGDSRQRAITALESMKAAAILSEAQAEEINRQREELVAQQEESRKAQAVIDEANQIQANKRAAEIKEIADKNAAIVAEEAEKKRSIDETLRIESSKAQAIEDEKARAKAEQEASDRDLAAREADKKHKGKIHSSIVAELMASGIDEGQAKNCVKALVNSPLITINY